MSTVKEIAERAGVSIGTVDRVIHNRGRVSVETRNTIERIIRDMNYKPNFFAKNLKLSINHTFSVLIPHPEQDSNFWQLLLPGIEKAKSELESYNINVLINYYDRNSEASFTQASEIALSQNPDALIIAPVVNDTITKFVNSLPDTIPFVFIDSKISDSPYLSFIGQNPFQSGYLAGKLMHLLVGDQAACSVVVFRSHSQEFHMNERSNGFCYYLEGKSNIAIKIVDIRGVENNALYKDLMAKCIAETPNIKGIFVTNAYAHSVAEWLEQNMPEKKIALIGYDLVKKNIDYVKKGNIDFLISLRPELQGYNAVHLLYNNLVFNKPAEEIINIPIDILTKENIDFY